MADVRGRGGNVHIPEKMHVLSMANGNANGGSSVNKAVIRDMHIERFLKDLDWCSISELSGYMLHKANGVYLC